MCELLYYTHAWPTRDHSMGIGGSFRKCPHGLPGLTWTFFDFELAANMFLIVLGFTTGFLTFWRQNEQFINSGYAEEHPEEYSDVKYRVCNASHCLLFFYPWPCLPSDLYQWRARKHSWTRTQDNNGNMTTVSEPMILYLNVQSKPLSNTIYPSK